MDHKLITTGLTIEGYKIISNLGITRGVMVRTINIFSGFAVGIRSIFGGRLSTYTKMCEKTRKDAFDQMIKDAKNIGANAIIGVRFDANEVASGITEVLCYGTAVIVEKI